MYNENNKIRRQVIYYLYNRFCKFIFGISYIKYAHIFLKNIGDYVSFLFVNFC